MDFVRTAEHYPFARRRFPARRAWFFRLVALASLAFWAPAAYAAAPHADFTVSPPAPVTGEAITFTSTSFDPDGDAITAQRWDLDGDGEFDDASGPIATRSFNAAGTYTIRLRVQSKGGNDRATKAVTVTGNQSPTGAVAFNSLDIVVRSDDPATSALISSRLLNPFPRVRIRGVATAAGVRLSLVSVRTGGGTRILARCRGSDCPWKRKLRLARFSTSVARVVRIPGLSRRTLTAGTVLEIFVTRSGRIGKYTRVKFRRLKPPLRVDSCTPPGLARKQRCPPA